MLPFGYNRIEDLRRIVKEHGGDLAAIVMEPARDAGPAHGFLEEVRALATGCGAVLVFDEITSGWRLNCGGIHAQYGVTPDIAAFAKAMSNGYAMAALAGVRSVMEAAQTSFISSTFWTEKIGPSAALAAIRKYRREKVHEHQVRTGKAVRAGWQAAAAAAGIEIDIKGIEPLSNFSVRDPRSQELATLFTQEMLDRNYLAAPRFNATLAHTPELVADYLEAVGEVFAVLAQARARDDVGARLRGPVKHSDFRRLA
jgi:glutamate-1-semialdehyde aminotransferase